jgi:hypothetical protein
MDSRTAKLVADRPKGFARVIYDAKAWARMNRSTVRIASIAAFVVIAIGYYASVVLPAQRQEQRALQTLAAERLSSETSARQVETETCLAQAETDSEARWKAACKKRGGRGECVLPRSETEDLQRQEAQERNSCLVR